MDNILISGPDEQTHLKTLDAVLGKLEEYRLRVLGILGLSSMQLVTINLQTRYMLLWKHQHRVMSASYSMFISWNVKLL